mgnify:CR=1 FL=1
MTEAIAGKSAAGKKKAPVCGTCMHHKRDCIQNRWYCSNERATKEYLNFTWYIHRCGEWEERRRI